MQATPPQPTTVNKRFRQQQIPFRPRHASNQPQPPSPTYWGNYLGPKDPEHLRIFLQNPNRISARENFTDFEYLCQNLFTNDIDIFCLPETGIDWKQHHPRNRCLRGIKSYDPKKCRAYVSAVTKYLTEHHVFARVTRLEAQTEIRGFTKNIQKRWETIDRDLLRACIHAERLTRCQDRPAWSLKLHQASMMVAFWKIRNSEIKTASDFSHKLVSLITQIDWSDSPPSASTYVEVCTKLRSSQNKISTIRKQATKHRSDFLQQRAAAEALAGNQEEAKVLRRIERAEATKACFKLLRKYLKPTMRGGITKIEVEAPNGTTTMITDPAEMTSRILQRNQRHFSQATGTPFTQEPISNLLGICGETHAGIALTQGQHRLNLGDESQFPETQSC